MIVVDDVRVESAVLAKIAPLVRRDGDCLIWLGRMKGRLATVDRNGRTFSVRAAVFAMVKGWRPLMGYCRHSDRCIHPGHCLSPGPIADQLCAMDAGVFLAMLARYRVAPTPKPTDPVSWVGGCAVVLEAVPVPAKTRGLLRQRLAAKNLPTWPDRQVLIFGEKAPA